MNQQSTIMIERRAARTDWERFTREQHASVDSLSFTKPAMQRMAFSAQPVRSRYRAWVRRLAVVLPCSLVFFGGDRTAVAAVEPPVGSPATSVDLMTDEGVELMGGQWRYSDTKIIEVAFREAGSEGQPIGKPNTTYDYTPHAGPADYDDSTWPVIAATTLNQRRGNGRLGFNWYRINVTVPKRIGDFDPTGSTVVFDAVLDDYAEVWVNGELPRGQGQHGGSVIAGWNASNRLVIGSDVKPGQQIQLAVFGMNGPISNPPTNYIYVRNARLDFYPGSDTPVASEPREVNVEVERLDPAIDDIVPPNPKVFKLAEGFEFTEGPLWVREGYLLFSDPNANRIYKYQPEGVLSVFKEHSGYSGEDVGEYGQPGSNGLTLDPRGRLTINEHGNHRVTRTEPDGSQTIIADNYQGKRLNSPNDLVYKSDGALYFTDPPFGLPKFFDDPRKELPYSGVYRWKDGVLQLLASELTGPNGLAFSPDEKYLYVDNWDVKKKVIVRYPVNADGGVEPGVGFFDMTGAPGEEALDGLKVDAKGNLYVSGPGGVWVISAQGKHLGTIRLPMLPANFAWGDADGKTLYMTARTGLYKMRLNIEGIHP